MPSPSRYLTLPEEFVLLSHLESGKLQNFSQASFGCAAAELGELALRGKLLIRHRKKAKYGLEILWKPSIALVDTGRTGLAWADALLAELEAYASEPDPVALHRWLGRRRREVLNLHRQALTTRGLLARRPGGRLGKDRYYPCAAARTALTDELRTGFSDRSRLDTHLLFLCDLVEAAEISNELSFRVTWRQMLDRLRSPDTETTVPEELRDTSSALRAMVPSRKD